MPKEPKHRQRGGRDRIDGDGKTPSRTAFPVSRRNARLRLRDMPRLCRRGLAARRPRPPTDGGRHARLRPLDVRPNSQALLSDQRSADAHSSGLVVCACPIRQFVIEFMSAMSEVDQDRRRLSLARARCGLFAVFELGLLDIKCHLIDIPRQARRTVRRALSGKADLRHSGLPDGDRPGPDRQR